MYEPTPFFQDDSDEPLPPNDTVPGLQQVTEEDLDFQPAESSEQNVSETPASKGFKFAFEKELEELTSGVVPESTSRSTKWALKTFYSWCEARNKAEDTAGVPSDLLTNPDINLLNKYLAMFAVEARKANGELYPPATLHHLLCGLLRHMREVSPCCPNFLDKKDKFKKLHNTLDSHFH